MENRRSARTSLRQQVGIESPRVGSVAAFTHDLSLGGMFVEIDAVPLPPNASVTVTFALPGRGAGQVVLDAVVVRRGAAGLGLMFLKMDPDVIRMLSAALASLREAHPSRIN